MDSTGKPFYLPGDIQLASIDFQKVGNTIYVSGQGGIDPAGNAIEGGLTAAGQGTIIQLDGDVGRVCPHQ